MGLVETQKSHDGLQRARTALINLVHRFGSQSPGEATIVFDSSDAPKNLPKSFSQNGINVLFAVDFDTADELIIEMIRKEPVPAKLTVVSSDWQIKTAALRRKATPINSDDWYDQIIERRNLESRQRKHSQNKAPASVVQKKEKPQSQKPLDIDSWLNFFDIDSDETISEIEDELNPSQPPPAKKEELKQDVPEEFFEEFENPFPPGYGEDLLGE